MWYTAEISKMDAYDQGRSRLIMLRRVDFVTKT
jgi:hypothetical protein